MVYRARSEAIAAQSNKKKIPVKQTRRVSLNFRKNIRNLKDKRF
jgi:hypothetical protein